MTAVLPLSHSFHHGARMQQAVIILFEKLFSPRPRMPAGGGFFLMMNVELWIVN